MACAVPVRTPFGTEESSDLAHIQAGTPLPGPVWTTLGPVTLTDLRPGASFVVSRIPEELEFAPGLLDFLEENDILPGRSGTLTVSSPDGTTTVEIDGRHVGVGQFASSRILVTSRS